MPQLDPSVFSSQLFWLALTFIPLYLILWKAALPRVTSVREARRARIDADLEKAAAIKSEAEAALADYEKTIAEAMAKAQATIRESAQSFANEAAAQREALSTKLAAQVADAERRISEEKNRALGDIGDIANELTQAASARLLGGDIGADEAKSAVKSIVAGGSR
ncbi:MAG: F0F1 ATP synthase subunit B' [Alphaproteobacteria bacterium]|nr:F0F1 ATP synthase subunit B' [Alphaproteobacteria bacterium]